MQLSLRLFVVVLLTCFFSGCAWLPSQETRLKPKVSSATAALAVQDYLAKARQSTPPQSYEYLLEAARLYLQQHEEAAAKSLLTQVPAQGLPIPLDAKRRLLVANIAARNEQPAFVLQALSGIPLELLTAQDRALVYETRALAFAKAGDWLQSAKERILLDPLLLDEIQIKDNRQAIWDLLSHLSNERLVDLTPIASRDDLNGWAQLILTVRQGEGSPASLIQNILKWQQAFPEHPGQLFLPANLELAMSLPSSPRQIALLLPLSGPHAIAAKAIQEGFISAYDHDLKQRPSIKLYDTSEEKDISELYTRVVTEGAEFVVGPLTKPDAGRLALRELSVPVIALNNVETKPKATKFFQFALAPEEEARRLAEHAYGQGLRQVGILAVENPWDKRMVTAFKQRWFELGGRLVTERLIAPQADLAETVRSFLGIDTHSLKLLAEAKRKGIKGVQPPHPRSDLQMIFMVAPGAQARQLRPLIKFYFAGHIPIYAASNFYEGRNNPKPDRDMNGVIFADMPWLLEPKIEYSNLRQHFNSLKEKEMDHYERFYAMGVDAYQLVYQLPRLLVLSQATYRGLTGALFVDQHQVLHRQLTFAKIIQGEPKLIN